jgi:hypothetical protein
LGQSVKRKWLIESWSFEAATREVRVGLSRGVAGEMEKGVVVEVDMLVSSKQRYVVEMRNDFEVRSEERKDGKEA